MARNTSLESPASAPADEIQALVDAAVAKRAKGPADPFANIEAKVDHAGQVIILPAIPEDMSYKKGIEWLTKLDAQDKEIVEIHEPIDCFHLDGAVAFARALKALFGFYNPTSQEVKGFFGTTTEPPTMMSVEVGFNERVTTFWGAFLVPGVEGKLQTSSHRNDDGRFIFLINGKVTRRSLKIVHKICELTREFVSRDSIYRGKALELRLDGDGGVNFQSPPKFIDLGNVKEGELIFSDEVMDQIRTNLFAPLAYSAACRAAGIPLKRTVLMEGPFGTGKTLCANVSAQKAVANGWTFINIARASALSDALSFAQHYQPSVVFAEDIDREVGGNRSVELDHILNTIDGVLSKDKEIMVVLTSNEAEKINPAMLRPGRIDAILRIDPPDAKATDRLLRLYGRGLVADSTDLTASSKALAGQIPAVIREAVERAKLYAIGRGATLTKGCILDVDIASAAQGMSRHLELLRGKTADPTTIEHKVGESIRDVLVSALTNGKINLPKMRDVIEEIHNQVC